MKLPCLIDILAIQYIQFPCIVHTLNQCAQQLLQVITSANARLIRNNNNEQGKDQPFPHVIFISVYNCRKTDCECEKERMQPKVLKNMS